jgi:hypothetical protein
MAKLFAKFGAKRDENLGDLRSTTTALNTLLDRIKGGKRKFDVDDLKLIEGIFATDVTTATFNSAAAATVRFTASNGTSQVYEPLITLQNRFDRAYFTTSEPYFAGGDGLTARYFDNPQILRASGTDSTSNWAGFDQVYDSATGRPTIDPALEGERATQKDQFWEEGDFVYGNKIVNKLLTAYGGVEWTGFYKVETQGSHSIRIFTTGFVKVEFDNLQAPSKEFTFDVGTGTFRLDDLDFKNPSGITTRVDQTRLVGAGTILQATITGTRIEGGQINASYGTIGTFRTTPATGTSASFSVARDLNGDLYIAGINGGGDYSNGGTFTIAGNLIGGTAGVTPGTGDDATITITEVGGYEVYDSIAGASTNIPLGTTRQIDIPLGILEPFVPYKIKISFFMDEDAVEKTLETSTAAILSKNIQFQRIIPISGLQDEFDYKLLYNEKYFDFYNIGDFKRFIDDSISFAGSKVSLTDAVGKQTSTVANGVGVKGSRYKTLANLNPVVSYYKPKINLPVSGITVTRTGTWAANQFTIDLTPTTGLANRTEGIEEGNYVLADGVYTGSRVATVTLNNSVTLDLPIQSSRTSTSVTFVDHRGLVAYGKAGRYSNDIISGGLVEKGFSMGARGIAVVGITDGAAIDISKANQNYGTFSVGTNLNSNAGGTGATFNISRNQFGALVITVTAAGSGYSNYEYFTVDSALIQNPNDVTFEIKALTDSFFIGKAEYNITEDLIFKQVNWPNSLTYTDKVDNPSVPVSRTASQTAIVERFQAANDAVRSLPRNAFVFKDQTATLPASTTDQTWFIYQSFGLNNNALAPFCQGVYAKRIIQKLEVVNAGTGYTSDALTGGGATVTGGSGNGQMKIYYVVNGTGGILRAWTVSDGSGYNSGDVVTVQASGSGNDATLRVGYPNLGTNSVTLRLSDAKDLTTTMYAHLFPSVAFIGTDVNSLTSDVQITAINTFANDPGTYVTIARSSGSVLNAAINYVPTVVTRITFSPTQINKEVCFRPTDTSPPFSATARGLSTSFDVKMVRDFTSRTGNILDENGNLIPASPGVANTGSLLTYDKLELETFIDPASPSTTNETLRTSADYIGGYIPITTPSGQFYIITSKVP